MEKVITVKSLTFRLCEDETIHFQVGETGDIHVLFPDEAGYKNLAKLFVDENVPAVEAVTLRCPVCKESCVNEAGSAMFKRHDKTVYCPNCGEQHSMPANASRLLAR